MRTICLAMATAAVSLSMAAPISAQSNHKRSYSHQLQMQIEAGVNRGTISASENSALRGELGRLLMLERRLSPNGINGREHARLTKASIALARDIRIATRNSNLRGEKQASWESGNVNGHWVPDARFAGLRPGDRFSGDIRVGQRATARVVNLPTEYRGQYVDDARVYYGYDRGRVYQIDRQSQMILALLDTMPSKR